MVRTGAVPFAIATYLWVHGPSDCIVTQRQEPDMTPSPTRQAASNYELRFRSLFDEGRGLSFPCDASGQVDIDSLGARARANYFFARTVIGREFAMPAVLPCNLH
jgi:hypothetical protein